MVRVLAMMEVSLDGIIDFATIAQCKTAAYCTEVQSAAAGEATLD